MADPFADFSKVVPDETKMYAHEMPNMVQLSALPILSFDLQSSQASSSDRETEDPNAPSPGLSEDPVFRKACEKRLVSPLQSTRR